MKVQLTTSLVKAVDFSSTAFESFHRRAREFGSQSAYAAANSERLQNAALMVELCALGTATGAVVGAAAGGVSGAAIGACIGLTGTVIAISVNFDFEQDESLYIIAD